MRKKPAAANAPSAGPDALRERAEQIARDSTGGTLTNLHALSSADAQRLLHDLQVHQIELELQNEELRRAQNALEASRARYFDLYDLAPVGYFTLSENGMILEANLTSVTLLGVTRGMLVRQPLGRFIAGDDAHSYYRHLRQLFRSGESHAFELRFARQGGAPFAAWIEASLATDDDGARVCRMTLSDITAHKATQEKLRQTLGLLQAAGKMAHMGGWSLTVPDNVLTWSDEMCALLDFPSGHIPSYAQGMASYTTASREIITAALTFCAHDGTPFDCEVELYTAKRRLINGRCIGQAVRNDRGDIIRIEGALQDITAQKNAAHAQTSLQAQLRESQKMEAIGTLAGGVAHDFNNILSTILGNVELARRDARANWQALVSLDEIQRAGLRARDLVQQILAFSRHQPTTRRVISLPAIVEESARLLRAALPKSVRVECRCTADPLFVLADPTQVEQVLLNLGTNAAQAMEGEAGRIEIRLEAVTLDTTASRIAPNLRARRYGRVVVSDTGHGMSAATLGRIFEPFFTTKPAGKGTGLGLSVAYSIMQAHEGAITVHSEPGKGSRFELYLPWTSAIEETPAAAAGTVDAVNGANQKVLYIDDDEAQVFMTKRLLECWGYRVDAYVEQSAALSALLAGELACDLVLTDFNMPGMSGLEIARAIHEARPDLPVIVISGYISDSMRAQAQAAGVRELVAKPVDMDELRDMMQRHMGA